MIPDLFLFFLLSFVAILSALGMLLSESAIYSAINLVLNFVTVAIIYLVLGAPFIALTQITVYAGAIMILFLFVIMLLGSERLPDDKVLPWQKPMAITLAVILLFEAVYIIFVRPVIAPVAKPLAEGFGSPLMIGEALFNKYLLPFEITSLLLLVAIIGAVVLTSRKKTVPKE
jgi:NADH-quinone oxidoreductase subunit J